MARKKIMTVQQFAAAGGAARAASLSDEQRSEIARRGGLAKAKNAKAKKGSKKKG